MERDNEAFKSMVAEKLPDLDLSKVVYTKLEDLVEVSCLKHDLTSQVKLRYLSRGKNPCPLCGGKTMTQEQFITVARRVHGDKFDYSKTVLVKRADKVLVTCLEHGDFEQVAYKHIQGFVGCSECSGQTRITRDKLIERSKSKYGEGTFDYSRVSEELPEAMHTKIDLCCTKHNQWFKQTVNSHLQGTRGCPRCYNSKMTMERLEEKARQKLPGKKYDYSRVDLSVNVKEKNTIGCQIEEHGFFQQSLDNHLRGREGCPICRKKKKQTA